MSFNYPLWAEVNVECAKGKTGTIAASRPS